MLYGDAPSQIAECAAARFRSVSRRVFRGVPEEISWHHVASTYVVCANDKVVHPALQRMMARRATLTVEWPCGHSPASTQAEQVADLLADRMRGIG